jgi:hypothetical protein
MSLRKSPTPTPGFLAANRANAQKCTGPRTPAGKARSSLNAIKHGGYARGIPEKLRAAGDVRGVAFHARIRREIVAAFRIADPPNLDRAERFATTVYAMARRAEVMGTKPECPSFEMASGPRSCSYSRFRICDPRNLLGMVFWVQRKGFWNRERLFAAMFHNSMPKEPPLRRMLELCVRHRVFRMRRPSIWEMEDLRRGERGLGI